MQSCVPQICDCYTANAMLYSAPHTYLGLLPLTCLYFIKKVIDGLFYIRRTHIHTLLCYGPTLAQYENRYYVTTLWLNDS